MVMGIESSYTAENNGHVKTQLAEELSVLTEGVCANYWRFDNKPGGHELTARPLHSRDKTKCKFLGFGTSLYGTSRSTKPNL